MGHLIKLYCKMKKGGTKQDMAPIYIRVRFYGAEAADKLFTTEKSIPFSSFDNATGKALKGYTNATLLNNYLDNKVKELENFILDKERDGITITMTVIDSFFNKQESFLAFALEELNEQRSKSEARNLTGKKRARKELGHHHCMTIKSQLNKLEAFAPTLTFKQLTTEFLEKYEHYLTVEKKNKVNTIHSDMRTIRKYVLLAIKKGLTKNNPFKEYDLHKEDVVKSWLTLKEVELLHDIYDYNVLSAKLQNTLFYFLISCYTGLRYGDMKRDVKEFIKDGKLNLETNKTGAAVYINLSERTLRLIESEDAFKQQLKVGNHRVNTDLGEIMKNALIDKHITFHCSRHSFAINCLILGISLPVVSRFLGHSSIKTTQIYGRIVEELMNKEMEKWNYSK